MIPLEQICRIIRSYWVLFLSKAMAIQVQIENKGKNKSRKVIFYQMKGFFLLRSVVGSVFFVNQPGAHN